MWPLCLAFVDIALHRRGPQHLPASEFLLGLVLAVYLVIGLAALQFGSTLSRAVSLLLFDTAVYLVAIWAVLKLFRRPRRFLQTATAFVGTDAFLNTVALPLIFWDESLQAPPDQLTTPRLLFLLLLIWHVDIGGYILSKAVEKPYIVGVSIVIVYVLTSMQLRETLFPPIG
ncbi:MAG TPA: hypothetical protein VF329_08600 [Gammaproteobacteria bacterium]